MKDRIEPNVFTKELLQRPAGGQVHFSDVFPELTDEYDECWWRKTDFDASLTQQVESESSGFPEQFQVPIGLRPWLANYGLVLADDLLWARNRRIANNEALGATKHPDQAIEEEYNRFAVIALANKAPRDETHTNGGENGSDFYLAVTHAGLEIYTTPLSFLDYLDERHRILALYRIPTKSHPELEEGEQFRSARIVRSRRHPDHLVPIFEYASRKDLVAAKQTGIHPDVIPRKGPSERIAHVDKFGNIIINSTSISTVREASPGDELRLEIKYDEEEFELDVLVAQDLRSAPLGQLAVYQNCSSPQDKDSTSGFIELVSRVDDDPNRSNNTAIYQIQEITGEINPEQVELSLKSTQPST